MSSSPGTPEKVEPVEVGAENTDMKNKIDFILSSMSIEEKVGQMLQLDISLFLNQKYYSLNEDAVREYL